MVDWLEAVHRGRVPVVAITAGTLGRFAGSAAGAQLAALITVR